MKHILISVLVIIGILGLTACGEDEKKNSDVPKTYEIALVTDVKNVDSDPFAGAAWNAVTSFGDEFQLTYGHYDAEGDGSDEGVNEAGIKAVAKAKEKGAKVIIFAGSRFETAVHEAQKENEDIYFILIDGVPRDDEHNYELAANSTGVLFAEEEAGFLAGYAAVADGNNKIGFMGGKEIPPVKRYAYGFLQGIQTAAKDKGISGVELKYCYTDTFSESEDVKNKALDWYRNGTQAVFACGGSMGNSVIKAADYSGGKVIGVDTDQSQISESVITSAEKGIKTAVYDILKTYIHGNFKGNSIFNYSLENKGISLEMTNARFSEFNSADYNDVLNRIKSGEIKIEKEMGSKDLEELAEKTITVTEEEISTSDSQD